MGETWPVSSSAAETKGMVRDAETAAARNIWFVLTFTADPAFPVTGIMIATAPAGVNAYQECGKLAADLAGDGAEDGRSGRVVRGEDSFDGKLRPRDVDGRAEHRGRAEERQFAT